MEKKRESVKLEIVMPPHPIAHLKTPYLPTFTVHSPRKIQNKTIASAKIKRIRLDIHHTDGGAPTDNRVKQVCPETQHNSSARDYFALSASTPARKLHCRSFTGMTLSRPIFTSRKSCNASILESKYFRMRIIQNHSVGLEVIHAAQTT
jgi:hypothetical protein